MKAPYKIYGKIYPEDHKKNIGTLGIKLPMNSVLTDSNFDIFNMSYTTEEQAVSNFTNLLLTKPGERWMHPTYGIGIQLYLFEQNTDLLFSKLNNIILEQAGIWLPYINILSLNIISTDEINGGVSNGLNIMIEFNISKMGNKKIIAVQPSNMGGVNIGVE